jgi:hypothetical protein
MIDTSWLPPDVPVDIPDVVARLRLIDERLPRGDGFWWFNKLYLIATLHIDAAHRAGEFEDAGFLSHWDALFAQLYFVALRRASTAPDDVPRAWKPLCEARSARAIAPLQFALAGMNAHINRDLPVSLFDACRERGLVPARGTAVERDFLKVNEILQRAQDEAAATFSSPFFRWVDRVLGRTDDALRMWSIERARDAAWHNTEMLWALRDAPADWQRHLAILDGLVGYAGRGLLHPAPAWLPRCVTFPGP